MALVAALAGAAASLVVETGLPGNMATAAADLATASKTARALRATLNDGDLHSDGADLAGRMLAAAVTTLERTPGRCHLSSRLSGEGWSSLLGPAGRDEDGERLGRSAVVERAVGPGTGASLLKDLA